MSKHPQAQTLNLLIVAEGQQREHADAFEYAIYRVIDRYLDWPEAKKADLYAGLAEKYDPKGRIIDNENLVSDVMNDTEANWRQS